MIGIGVVGVGLMGRRHAENVLRLTGEARLVAVADADAALATRVAAELGATACSVDDLLGRSDVHAVIVASPPGSHEAHAVAAARAGKDILLEKPIAPTVDAADRICAVAEGHAVRLQIGFQRRYDAAYAEAHRLVRSGSLGAPLFFKGIDRDLVFSADLPPALGRADILVQSAIHDFDMARWLLADEVVAVRATLDTHPGGTAAPGPRLALVDMRFTRGALGDVETFRGCGYAYDIRAEIVCEDATLIVGGFRQERLTLLRPNEPRADLSTGFLERFADAYLAEVRDFVRGAHERRPPAVTGDDGRRGLAIALAADAAAAAGCEVAVAP